MTLVTGRTRLRLWLSLAGLGLGLGLVAHLLTRSSLSRFERELVGSWRSTDAWRGPAGTYDVLILRQNRLVHWQRYDEKTGEIMAAAAHEAWHAHDDSLTLLGSVYWDEQRNRPRRGWERYRLERSADGSITLTLVENTGLPIRGEPPQTFTRWRRANHDRMPGDGPRHDR